MEDLPAYKRLAMELIELLISVGLMSSVMPQMPEDVQQNWDEKIEGMILWARQQTGEVQQFGEAYDEEDEEAGT